MWDCVWGGSGSCAVVVMVVSVRGFLVVEVMVMMFRVVFTVRNRTWVRESIYLRSLQSYRHDQLPKRRSLSKYPCQYREPFFTPKNIQTMPLSKG